MGVPVQNPDSPPSGGSPLDGLRAATDQVRAVAGQLRLGSDDNSSTLDEVAGDLADWWQQVAEQDAERAAEKAAEYGQLDLEIMGTAMVGLVRGTPGRTERIAEMTSDQQRRLGLDMALAFYELGKVARTFGAYAAGRMPSDDTWHDTTVYSMMARRVRETGSWVAPS
jgi:hypothetical protein